MLDQQWLQCVVALCLLFAPQGLQAGYPVVGRSAGTLAVQSSPQAGWRVIAPGGILPDVGEARTTATGPSRLQSDRGALSLGSLSKLQYDLTARQATLQAGKVFCAPATDNPWTINTATARVAIPSGGVEVSLDASGNLTITALEGQAEVTIPGSAAVTVAERTVCLISGKPAKATVKPLEPAAAERLAAWTRQLPPGQGVGQLVIKDSHGGTGTRLNIARYHAEVVLQPPVALVKLDQSFYNPSSRQEEGEFLFNLPPGASVSRFAMFVTKDQLIEGEVIERKRADEVYTTIVRSKRDPAILEQIGDSLFKMRVFPIFPKDIKRILLDFTLPLDGRSGQYQMQLPLLSNLLPIWDFRVFGAIRGPTPLASAQCPTIPGLKFASNKPNEISFNFEQRNYQPNSDLLIAFQQPAPEIATTFRQLRAAPLRIPASPAQTAADLPASLNPDGSISNVLDKWNGESGVYFQADLPVPPNPTGASPADVLLLVDTSGNGTLEQVRPALQTVLASLRKEDRFRLVCVDVVSRPLHEGWIQASSPAAQTALQHFEQQICLGATDMLATCRDIVPQFANHDPDRRPVVIYIGDGLHSVDDVALRVLAERSAREITDLHASLFTINTLPPPAPALKPQQGFGGGMGGGQGFFQFGGRGGMGGMTGTGQWRPSQNSAGRGSSFEFDGRLFLTELTKHAGGRNFDFTDVAGDRGRLFEWLLSGLPTPTRIEKLTVRGCEPIDLYYPANLLPGEPFRITGRKLGELEKLEITYKINTVDAPWQSLELTPAANHEDHLVGRYWASQRLRHLQRLQAAPANGGGLTQAANVIVSLSCEWSLLTPQTAFLVLETEADYASWNVPRQGRRRYWAAEDVPTVLPLAADWLARIEPKEEGLTGSAEVDQQLEAARKALTEGDYLSAAKILERLQTNETAVESPHYTRLKRDLANRRGIAVQSLGVKQAWFDLQHSRTGLPSGIDHVLTNFGTITTEFLERHPFAEQLLQEIDMPENLLVGDVSLDDFVQFLRVSLDANVFLDKVKLAEESIPTDASDEFPMLKKISARNLIHHVLSPRGLTLIEEPRRLVVTTKTEAINARKRILFPARDLLMRDPKFHLDDLQDPIFDREQAATQRIENKLKKLTNIRLEDASLDDLVVRLHKELDENILLDTNNLEDESIATDARDITCDYKNVPLGEALKWVLDAKTMTCFVDRETLRLTTKTEAVAHRTTQVYPAYGLLFRDMKPRSRQQGMGNQWGGGWGMGGGMMRGMGFGGMGGMGGGFGGGMGGIGDGIGGGMGGGFGGSDLARLPLDSMSNAIEGDAPATSESDNLPLESGEEFIADNAGEILMDIQQQTGGPPDAPWMESDGEGGNVAYFYPSLCYAFRQTREAHAEIAEYFRQQRSFQNRRGTNPAMIPISPRDALSRNELDAGSLINLIQQLTGGPPYSPWMEYDGQGADISYDRARMALAINQTSDALDEIAGVLLQLRRERYALKHRSRFWENVTATRGPQTGLFNGGWLAQSTFKDNLVRQANEPELAALKVRRELTSGSWKWSGNTQASSSAFTLLTQADRLQLNWGDREARLKGAEGVVYASTLQYAEFGNWGDGLRDWLDVELVFWPHRSNRELATMFNVVPLPAQKQDVANQIRLQFTPAKLEGEPISIEIVYDKTTGLPVVWESFKFAALVQRFRFQPEVNDGQLIRLTARQESPAGELLGTGEWTPTNSTPEDPTALPKGTLTLDRRSPTGANGNPLDAGWQFMQRGEYVLAEAQFRQILEEFPTHPLGQFLLAWSLNRQLTETPQEKIQTAYTAVLQNGPSELARSLIKLDGGRLSDRQLYELLKGRPAAKRDLDDEVTLTRLSLQLNAPEAALEHAQAAWNKHPESATQRLEVAQFIITSQLRLGRLPDAVKFYEQLRDQEQITQQLIPILETFEYFEKGEEIPRLYHELLERKDPSITGTLRRTLLLKYAKVTTGMTRWQALLSAIELLPSDVVDADVELAQLAAELTAAGDVAAAATLALRAKSAARRQELQFIQANLTSDLAAAQKLYWQLHQEGYLFRDQPVLVSDRLIEAKHPEQAVAILEALVRAKRKLTLQQRRTLSDAYRLTDRPLDAKRAMSE